MKMNMQVYCLLSSLVETRTHAMNFWRSFFYPLISWPKKIMMLYFQVEINGNQVSTTVTILMDARKQHGMIVLVLLKTRKRKGKIKNEDSSNWAVLIIRWSLFSLLAHICASCRSTWQSPTDWKWNYLGGETAHYSPSPYSGFVISFPAVPCL